MEKTLDFKVIFYLLRKKAVWIILATIIGALVAFLYSENFIPKKYTSAAEIYISNAQEVTNSEINYADLTASKSLASTYCIILQSEKARVYLKEELNANEYYQKLDANIKSSYTFSVSVKDESEVLRISSTSLDAELSAVVCNSMINVASKLIKEIFDGGRSNSLGDAKKGGLSSPNVKTNSLVGAVFAFAIVSVIFISLALLDNRVKDEADFVLKVNVPVLGEVPSIHEDVEAKEGYYYAYSKKQDD